MGVNETFFSFPRLHNSYRSLSLAMPDRSSNGSSLEKEKPPIFFNQSAVPAGS
jgi:hypothetical protein